MCIRTLRRVKRCGKCQRDLPATSFYKRARAKDGLQARCKDCNLQEVKDWQRKNGKSSLHRQSRYGLTKDEVAAFLHVPACQACGSKFESESDMRFDHCHQLGHMRGVLCHRCNITCLSDAEECVIRMEACLAYLLRDLERNREQTRAN